MRTKAKPKRGLEGDPKFLSLDITPPKKRKLEINGSDEKYPLKSPKIAITPEDKYGRSQSTLPLKKRLKTIDKENQLSNPVKSPLKKVDVDKVLKSKKLNSEKVSENSSEGEDDSDTDIDDIFKNLKKSGIKAVNNRKSPKTPSSDKKDKSSSKKKPELEKSPDSLILNYKRTPKKKDYDGIESPSKKIEKTSDAKSSPKISLSTSKSRRRIVDDEEEKLPKRAEISKSRKQIIIDDDDDENDSDSDFEVKGKNKRGRPLKSSNYLKKTPKYEIVKVENDSDSGIRKKLKTVTPIKLKNSSKKTPRTPKNAVVKYDDREKETEEIVNIPILRTPRSTRRSCNGEASLNSPLSSKVSSARRSSRIIRNEISEPIEEVWSVKKNSGIKRNEGFEATTPTTKKVLEEPRTPLEKARQSLHVSTVPESLPCREKEYNNILKFVENKLLDNSGGCMYISGVPGTGKTATVTQVIRYLQDLSIDGTIPQFKYIEINGMRLADPRQAYVQLCQKLFNNKEKLAPDVAHQKLDNWFSKSDRKNNKISTVLVVDELDLMCTKKQEIVHNILEWPTRTHSRLIVLTIANTMDIIERLFKDRVKSRLGLTRLTFLPYTHKQLEEIVSARLIGLNAFSQYAIQLVSRKVASVSGDARRALDICRRATELPSSDDKVTIGHIEQAIREMLDSNMVKVIRGCCEFEKLFLRSMSEVSLRTGLEEVDFLDVFKHLLALSSLEGFSKPPVSAIITLSNRLKCSGLINTNQSQGGILQRLTLNVSRDDIHYALKSSS